MFSTLLYYIVTFVLNLASTLLTPLESLVFQYAPTLTHVLQLINSFIDFIINLIPWVLSWFNIPGYILGVCCDLVIGSIFLKVAVHGIKLGLAWYDILKP